MAKLVSSAIASLDGFGSGSAPDHEVHAFMNDLARPIGTHLYGRRMYETMVYWETDDDPDPVAKDYASIWRAADKVVFSRTLETPTSAKTRIEHSFDPEAIRVLKETSPADLTVGGAELAGQAMAAGLVDEYHLFVFPAFVGGGQHALPDNVRANLELLDERRFRSGVVYLRYRIDADIATEAL